MALPRNASSTRDPLLDQYRRANGQFGERPRGEENPVDTLDVDDAVEAMEASMKAAYRAHERTGAGRRGLDVEDVAQEALLAYYTTKAKGKEIDNVRAYLSTSARNVAIRAGRNLRSDDISAYNVFKSRRADLEQTLDRSLTANEERDLASDIYANWADKKHKPNVDFLERVRGVETTVDEIQWQGIDAQVIDHAPDNYIEPGSWMDRGFDYLEGDNRDLRAARAMAWNAIAERMGAPLVEPRLGHKRVTAAKAFVRDNGPVEALLDRWEDGDLDERDEALLFSPWGDASDDEKDAVVECLRDTGRCEQMWEAALLAASTRTKSGR